MVNERVGAGNWESGDELGDTWVSRNAFSYGRGAERGTARPEVLQELLKTTDRVVQVAGWWLPPCDVSQVGTVLDRRGPLSHDFASSHSSGQSLASYPPPGVCSWHGGWQAWVRTD